MNRVAGQDISVYFRKWLRRIKYIEIKIKLNCVHLHLHVREIN